MQSGAMNARSLLQVAIVQLKYSARDFAVGVMLTIGE
jgi:hypothetical protein